MYLRWKERFFILTNDYFHCFKKGSFKVTEMGEFIFKVTWKIITWYRGVKENFFSFSGETELNHFRLLTGQERLLDNLSDSGIDQGRKDLFEEGRGSPGLVLITQGGRRDIGSVPWATKHSLFQFNVDQKKTSRQPYSYLPETKMTGALAGGKKRYSKNCDGFWGDW